MRIEDTTYLMSPMIGVSHAISVMSMLGADVDIRDQEQVGRVLHWGMEVHGIPSF